MNDANTGHDPIHDPRVPTYVVCVVWSFEQSL